MRLSGPSGDFDGSGYGTSSGYLQAATKWFQPQVQAAKSEAEAKNLVQNFLQSLAPELERRGSKFGGAKNETITLDGKTYDMFRDIGGASEAQMLEMGLGGGGTGAAPMMGAGIGGNSIGSAIGGAASQGGPSATLQQILAQLAGGATPENDTLAQARTLKQNAKSQAYEKALS